ncbi:MAG: hypothetical protein HBSAPP03_24450 [Phycisphaerae bacterium]|nr:MAG: hypothetical protein HBSAPP03_24450 [Phycisphaerae bacterium]
MVQRLALSTLVCCLGVGCSDRNTPAALAPADQTYTVLGTIEQLPADGRPLMVHHQPIPEFVGKNGRVVGMREMTMEFANLAPGVSLSGLKAGDPISMTFEVRWNATPRTRVTAISAVPGSNTEQK